MRCPIARLGHMPTDVTPVNPARNNDQQLRLVGAYVSHDEFFPLGQVYEASIHPVLQAECLCAGKLDIGGKCTVGLRGPGSNTRSNMGYSHYFAGLRASAEVIADAVRIVAASGVSICGPKGKGQPIMSEGIRLNGCDGAGESRETFHLRGNAAPRYPGMAEFCKTGNQPYDQVVTAILIAAAVRALGERTGVVMSDGRWDDWAAGLSLFAKAVRPLTMEEKLALELDVERMRPGAFLD